MDRHAHEPAVKENSHNNRFETLNDKLDYTVVRNLSDKKKLSENEINVLKKGTKFTPVPKMNNHELKNDVDQFCRTLRLNPNQTVFFLVWMFCGRGGGGVLILWFQNLQLSSSSPPPPPP